MTLWHVLAISGSETRFILRSLVLSARINILIYCPHNDFAQKAKSSGGILVARVYVSKSTYSLNIQSVYPQKINLDLLDQGPNGITG